MSIESVLDAVNGFGNGVTSTVTTVITVNYIIGENTVKLLSLIFGYIKSAIICLLQAIQIALEDLGVFLMESADSFVYTMEYLFSMIDASVAWIVTCYVSTKATIIYSANVISAGFSQVLSSITIASQNFGHALSLFGSSVILLVSLIPQACHFLYSILKSGVLGLKSYVLDIITNTIDSISNAPIETFMGLIGAILIAISLFRLTQKLIQNNSLSVAQVLRFSLRAFCFIYMNIIKCVVLCIRGVIGMVKMTLTHLHVTRFHHAGDSDAEEEVDNQGLIGHYDESDDNENERMNDKRRNYDLLLKRRQERKRGSRKRCSGKGGNADENVEEMLFEQVEREREDKLCVICQDKEKCIMILPCRHLCICQDCEGPLQLQNNHCPICRRLVRQTIKAYL